MGLPTPTISVAKSFCFLGRLIMSFTIINEMRKRRPAIARRKNNGRQHHKFE
jgi:hypothetical protein